MIPILYIIVNYSLCNIISESYGPFHIFERIRNFFENKCVVIYELITCMICLPIWTGAIMSIIDNIFLTNITFTPFNMIFNNQYWFIAMILDSLLASGGTWFLYIIENYITSKSDNK